jgi:hypothetical protein
VEKPILTRILSSATQTFLSPNKENTNRSNVLSVLGTRSGQKSTASPLKSPQSYTPNKNGATYSVPSSNNSSSSKKRKSSPIYDNILNSHTSGDLSLFASPVVQSTHEGELITESDKITQDNDDDDHHTFPDSDEDEEEEEQACFKRHTEISAYRVSMGGDNDTLDWKVFV